MTLDTRARRAAAQAHETVLGVAPASTLPEVLHPPRSRRVAGLAAAALLVALVGGAGYAVDRAVTGDGPSRRPAPAVSPHSAECAPLITCLGGRAYAVGLGVPVRLELPRGWQAEINTFDGAGDGLEVYAGLQRGVTLFEAPTPVRNRPDWRADPNAGATAESIARWLALRPFLRDSRATPIQIGSQRAWRVKAVLAPGARLRATRGMAQPVAPLFKGNVATSVLTWDMTAEFVVGTMPDGRPWVAWAWSVNSQQPAPPDPTRFLASLRFG